MEKIDILLWIIGGGFALMLVMWNSLHHSMCEQTKRIDETSAALGKRIDETSAALGKRIDETNMKIAEIDKRLYGIETVLHMKDCCVLKQDQHLKRVE